MKWLRSLALGWRFGERRTLCSPAPSSIQLSLQFPRLLPSGVQEWALAHGHSLSPPNGTSRTETVRVMAAPRSVEANGAEADTRERRGVTSVAALRISSSAHQSLVALRRLRPEEKQREIFMINYSLRCSTDGSLQYWYDYYEGVLKYHTDFYELKPQFHYSTLLAHISHNSNSATPRIYITVYTSVNIIRVMLLNGCAHTWQDHYTAIDIQSKHSLIISQ